MNKHTCGKTDEIRIPNHYSAKLSELDMQIALAVPPGGNWKDIPETVPSGRLAQIRSSYAAGKGSRSTYYGRLRADRPAYTINTFFQRPGNGCHLHYDYSGGQYRVLSQREAARLQSFPDAFVFCGSHRAVNTQIGNAVPPLLAYQIALQFPFRGLFVDLFCGAGGLSLGFKWAGWEPVVANDIEESFLQTYRENVHEVTVPGDIREREIFNAIIEHVQRVRQERPELPLLVLGGPPCQGFSTAGNRRSMNDERNRLFHEFKALLMEIRPTGFVFENVPGLQNMEGGRIFAWIKTELQAAANSLVTWKLHAEEYAIPQRRTRIFVIGHSQQDLVLNSPDPLTALHGQKPPFQQLAPAITVYDALSDLPPLQPGEDGSGKDYIHNPAHPYQALMRSCISAEEYLRAVKEQASSQP